MRLAALLALCAAALALARPAHAAPPDGSIVTYHNSPARTGAYIVPGLTSARAATLRRDAGFDGRVPGHVYAQPLYWRAPGAAHGLVIVATETDIVVALDAVTGREVWRSVLGTPARAEDLPCGDIAPLGITGTPVIDAARGTVYLDAMVMRGGQARHEVFALALADGSVRGGWPVDVAAGLRAHGMAFDPLIQNERGALSLVGGRLFVPFGGHDGDCRDYRGWVVSLSVAPAAVVGAWHTWASKGGIWAPGGLADDGHDLYATTGNTEGAQDWSGGEAVIRLPPDLAWHADAQSFFAPANWRDLDAADLDMSGTGPLPLDLDGRALVLALGKDGNAYLLDRAYLGGIGRPLVLRQVAQSAIITAPATWRDGAVAMVAFQAVLAGCPNGKSEGGIGALRVTGGARPDVRMAWCAALDGRGSPVVTTSDGTHDPIVWAAGAEGDERLHGFRGDTGAPVFAGGGAADRMAGVRRFVTVLVADGRFYVAGDGRVYAFAPP